MTRNQEIRAAALRVAIEYGAAAMARGVMVRERDIKETADNFARYIKDGTHE